MRKREADEPGLFDLPLVPEEEERPGDRRPGDERPGEERAREPAAEGREGGSGSLSLFPEDVEPGGAAAPPVRGARKAGSASAAVAEPPGTAVRAAAPSSAPPPGDPGLEAEPRWYRDPEGEAAPGPRLVPRRPVPAPFGARLVAALADLGVHLAVAGAGWLGTLLLGVRVDLADLPAAAVFLLAFSFLYAVVSLAFWGRTPGMAAAGVVSRGPGDQPLTFGQTGLRWLAGVLTAALAGLPLLVALTGRSLPDRLSGSTTLQFR